MKCARAELFVFTWNLIRKIINSFSEAIYGTFVCFRSRAINVNTHLGVERTMNVKAECLKMR